MFSLSPEVNMCNNVTCSDDNAHCVNSVGNYSCQCNPGFTGDGYNCSGKYYTYMYSYHSNLNFELQISMSVEHKMIRVLMRMLIVLLILSGISAVIVIQDSLEMVTLVLVNCL